MSDEGVMPTVQPTFVSVNDDNELYFHWRIGERWLSVYFNPPDHEEGPMDCFGTVGVGQHIDFESVWEGYRWLVSPAVGEEKERRSRDE